MNIRLYCITCRRTDLTYEEQVEQFCAGGADAVQFRDKQYSPREVLQTGQRLKEICHEKKVLFIINDRPDLALALDADGVHLGPDDIPLPWARQILGGRKVIGCSVSSLGQALSAARDGANYLAVGPIFSVSNRTDREVRGVDIIRMVKERVKIPVIAMGGIDPDNIVEAVKSGADGVAAARSLCASSSVKIIVSEMKKLVIQNVSV